MNRYTLDEAMTLLNKRIENCKEKTTLSVEELSLAEAVIHTSSIYNYDAIKKAYLVVNDTKRRIVFELLKKQIAEFENKNDEDAGIKMRDAIFDYCKFTYIKKKLEEMDKTFLSHVCMGEEVYYDVPKKIYVACDYNEPGEEDNDKRYKRYIVYEIITNIGETAMMRVDNAERKREIVNTTGRASKEKVRNSWLAASDALN